MKKKEFIITTVFIVALLIIYGLFPVRNDFQQFIVMVIFFIIIPIIFNKLILKRELKDIGIKAGNWKQGVIWSGISAIVVGLIFFISAYFFNFLKDYTIPTSIISNYKNFLFYEFALVLPAIFMYDFFFRGFTMLLFKNNLFYWAIVAQMLLFLLLVLTTGSFAWALFPYLISAPLAGVIVYKSESIFYSTAFQFVMIIIFDASIVHFIK